MYQASRGQYRTNESVIGMFFHSCFGKSVIAVVVIVTSRFIVRLAATGYFWLRCKLLRPLSTSTVTAR